MIVNLLLISSLAFGFGNWVPRSKLKTFNVSYSSKVTCENAEVLVCVELGTRDPRHFIMDGDNIIPDVAGKAAADAADVDLINKEIADETRLEALKNKLRNRRDGATTPATGQDIKDIIEFLIGE